MLWNESVCWDMQRAFWFLWFIKSTHILSMQQLFMVLIGPVRVRTNRRFSTSNSGHHFCILQLHFTIRLISMWVFCPEWSLSVIVARVISCDWDLSLLWLWHIHQPIDNVLILHLDTILLQMGCPICWGVCDGVAIGFIKLIINMGSGTPNILVVPSLVLKVQELFWLVNWH